MRLTRNYRTKKGQYLTASNYEQGLYLIDRSITKTFIMYKKEEEIMRFKRFDCHNLKYFKFIRSIDTSIYLFDLNFNKVINLEKAWFLDSYYTLCKYNKKIYFLNPSFEMFLLDIEEPNSVASRTYNEVLYTAIIYKDFFLIYKDKKQIIRQEISKVLRKRDVFINFGLRNGVLSFIIEDYNSNVQYTVCG